MKLNKLELSIEFTQELEISNYLPSSRHVSNEEERCTEKTLKFHYSHHFILNAKKKKNELTKPTSPIKQTLPITLLNTLHKIHNRALQHFFC